MPHRVPLLGIVLFIGYLCVAFSVRDFLFSLVVLVGLSLPMCRLCLIFCAVLRAFARIFLLCFLSSGVFLFSFYAFGVVLFPPPVGFGCVSGCYSLFPSRPLFPFAYSFLSEVCLTQERRLLALLGFCSFASFPLGLPTLTCASLLFGLL